MKNNMKRPVAFDPTQSQVIDLWLNHVKAEVMEFARNGDATEGPKSTPEAMRETKLWRWLMDTETRDFIADNLDVFSGDYLVVLTALQARLIESAEEALSVVFHDLLAERARARSEHEILMKATERQRREEQDKSTSQTRTGGLVL